MPKGEFICECDECHKMIFQGIEVDGKVFCNQACLESWKGHSSAARTSVSNSENAGSSPAAPAIPLDECSGMARAFLIEDNGCDEMDPDFPRWLARATGIFIRYAKIAPLCPRPIDDWPDEQSEGIDGVLETLDRKIKAAEEVLGVS